MWLTIGMKFEIFTSNTHTHPHTCTHAWETIIYEYLWFTFAFFLSVSMKHLATLPPLKYSWRMPSPNAHTNTHNKIVHLTCVCMCARVWAFVRFVIIKLTMTSKSKHWIFSIILAFKLYTSQVVCTSLQFFIVI